MDRLRAAFLAALTTVGCAHGAVSFNRDIRPIMSDTCFRCHGPDKNARMADLRLDIRDEALKARKPGVVPIVPGDPERSAIVQRIFATDARIMPPQFAHKELSQPQKDTVRQWVAEGAKYEGHWAYAAVERPSRGPRRVTRSTDSFIRARSGKGSRLRPRPTGAHGVPET